MALPGEPYGEMLGLSEAALVRRVEELDTQPPAIRKWVRDADSEQERRAGVLLEQFSDVMRRFPGPLIEVDGSPDAIIAPALADDLVGHCRLLAEIERFAPSLVKGPLDQAGQQWTMTGRSASNGDLPSAERFITPHRDRRLLVKPVGVGLWTSTAVVAERSMWRAYLQRWRKSVACPTPWHTWALDLDEGITVAEITSAKKWAEFVCAYPQIRDGRLYPDWMKVMQDFDAVHMTLSAIAAAQGFNFSTSQGVIPSEFWDVESTFWLKWRFSGARLVETVES